MSRTIITEESFLKDVEKHQIEIAYDMDMTGFRQLRFKEQETNINYFNVITHRGYLHFSGDMGCYSFHREDTDMIYFFNHKPINDRKLYINEGYWSEKCVAVDSHYGIKEWDYDVFEKSFLETLKNDYEFSDDMLSIVTTDILYYENPEEIYKAIEYFNREYESYEIDIELLNFENVYSNRFLWCLYALNWASQKYIEQLQINIERH